MSFVTKDGFWIESEDDHELIVPHAHRSKLNVIDDWSGMTQEELQNAVEEALERFSFKVKCFMDKVDANNTNLME